MLENKKKDVGHYFDILHQISVEQYHYWVRNTFLHWDWWITVGLTFIPWIVWFLFRKKESSTRLLFVGFFVIIATSYLDMVGVLAGKWYYVGKLVPTFPAYIPFDSCLLPVFVMFILQIRPDAPAFLKALIFSTISAFVSEPIFQWCGFYVMKDWSNVYSFMIYIPLYLIAHWLSRRNNYAKL